MLKKDKAKNGTKKAADRPKDRMIKRKFEEIVVFKKVITQFQVNFEKKWDL